MRSARLVLCTLVKKNYVLKVFSGLVSYFNKIIVKSGDDAFTLILTPNMSNRKGS